MINKIVVCLLIVACISGCQFTKLVGAYNLTPDVTHDFANIGIIFLSPSDHSKSVMEMSIAQALIDKGIKAEATFTLFPLAGKGLFDDQKIDPDTARKYVKARLEKFDFDAIMVVSVLDKQREVRQTGAVGVSFVIPNYGYNYYDYYGYMYNTIYDPTYQVKTTYVVEANLYDVASEQLIWVSNIKTRNPKSVKRETEVLARLVANELVKDKVLKQ